MEPVEMLEMYNKGGRSALINELCSFDREEVNEVMTEIVDCSIGAFKGDITVSSFVEQMECLNTKLYDTLTDVALDQMNEGDIDKENIGKCLTELQTKKSELDERVNGI